MNHKEGKKNKNSLTPLPLACFKQNINIFALKLVSYSYAVNKLLAFVGYNTNIFVSILLLLLYNIYIAHYITITLSASHYKII